MRWRQGKSSAARTCTPSSTRSCTSAALQAFFSGASTWIRLPAAEGDPPGECGHHSSSHALMAKATHHGFYWPTASEDADQLVRACNGWQRFGRLRHMPTLELKTIPITWPFA